MADINGEDTKIDLSSAKSDAGDSAIIAEDTTPADLLTTARWLREQGPVTLDKDDGHWSPVLLVMKEGEITSRFLLNKQKTFIGRSPNMDLYITADNMVSRRHARIIWENYDLIGEYPRCYIEDLQSRNGILVNRQKIRERESLNDGDRILVGSTIFIFYIKDSQELKFDDKMLNLIMIDSLSGLINRRSFIEESSRAIARARRYTTPLCLALFEIDNFKDINDIHGHGVGDELIRQVSAMLLDIVRDGDVLSCMGGDDFACLMPHTSVDEAIIAMNRIKTELSQCQFNINGNDIGITISVGLHPMTSKIERWHDLSVAADEMLYEAKKAGGNMVCSYKENE